MTNRIYHSTITNWRKSNRSEPNDGCVEAGSNGGTVAYRDTMQNGGGPVLAFARTANARFLAAVEQGTLTC
jgi:hypothetical protein